MENANETVHANVKFKDRLFRIVFGAEENKKHLISLYNALNGTNLGIRGGDCRTGMALYRTIFIQE